MEPQIGTKASLYLLLPELRDRVKQTVICSLFVFFPRHRNGVNK